MPAYWHDTYRHHLLLPYLLFNDFMLIWQFHRYLFYFRVFFLSYIASLRIAPLYPSMPLRMSSICLVFLSSRVLSTMLFTSFTSPAFFPFGTIPSCPQLPSLLATGNRIDFLLWWRSVRESCPRRAVGTCLGSNGHALCRGGREEAMDI